MNKIGYNSLSGMELEMRRQEVLANNLAAASVAGYKSEFMVSSPFKNEMDDQHGLGGVMGGTLKIDYSQGELKHTGRNLDFAIQGEGFFQVSSTDGQTLYTRNGSFRVSNDLKLITDSGMSVMDENGGEITFLPQDNLDKLEIGTDGTLKVMGGGSNNYTYRTIGKLKVQQIANKENLERLTGSYYRMQSGMKPKELPDPKPSFTVENAMLESANTSPIKTMTMLIQSSREFEISHNVMKMLSEAGTQEQQTFTS